jgi:DNA polymerase I-like protein with 3'-5' exonuclease and polymerase domains
MQNLPQEFKKFLVADPGYVLWEVDKRQAEWVVVAYLTQDANMLSVVESGQDTHIHTASLMFNVEKELLEYEAKIVGNNSDSDYISGLRTSDDRLRSLEGKLPRTMSARQCGKKSNHGLNYDEGFAKFALINEMEQSESKRIWLLYRHIYPGLPLWYEAIKRQLSRDRTLTNCFGRKVRFMDAWGPDLWKAAYSMLPQSTVVDSLNQGMVRIYHDEELCDAHASNIDLLGQVHDSILLQVPEWLIQDPSFQDVQKQVYDYVSPELTYNGRTFKIATDSKFGLNWGGFHKELNPLGMREVKSHNELKKTLGELGVQARTG